MDDAKKRVVIETVDNNKYFGLYLGLDSEIENNPKHILRDDKGHFQKISDSKIIRIEVLN